MVEETVERIRPLIPAQRMLLVADAGQTRALRKILPKMPAASFLVEPLARKEASDETAAIVTEMLRRV